MAKQLSLLDCAASSGGRVTDGKPGRPGWHSASGLGLVILGAATIYMYIYII